MGDPRLAPRKNRIDSSNTGISGFNELIRVFREAPNSRFRDAVVDDKAGRDLERIVAKVESSGLDIGGETLKVAPRGYPRDHPRVRLLRHTNLIGWREAPVSDLVHSREALEWVRDAWSACRPMVTWLRRHVGAPE